MYGGTKRSARLLSAAARATDSVRFVQHASSARTKARVSRHGRNARPTCRRISATSGLFAQALFRRCTTMFDSHVAVASHRASAAESVCEFTQMNCGNAFCTSMSSARKAKREKAVRCCDNFAACRFSRPCRNLRHVVRVRRPRRGGVHRRQEDSSKLRCTTVFLVDKVRSKKFPQRHMARA